MTSANFDILSKSWPELAVLGRRAEAYVLLDARSSIFYIRLLAENLVKDIYRDLRLPTPIRATQIDLLTGDTFVSIVPRVLLNKLHAIRKFGNKAVHGDDVSRKDALWLLKEAHDLGKWLVVYFDKTDPASLPSFKQPVVPTPSQSKGELQRQKKKALVKLATQEAQLNDLLEEVEQAREKIDTAERKAEELEQLASDARQSADILKFDEATTRSRIIDELLAASGWNVSAGNKSNEQVGKEIKVNGQPTDSGIGYCDYVLYDADGSPLAVIEAKKASISAEKGRKQAALYADALEQQHGIRPVIYYTNGYDIWMWDDAAGYPPRKIYGYYSPDSLQYLVKFQRRNRKALCDLTPKEEIVNRLYQIEAVKSVSERFEEKKRKALIVQATGTGKTRVAIALAEMLIRAGWAKRVLFLCDRKELRRQAKNAFTDHLSSEPVKIVNSKVSGNATERIFIATYPAMLRVYQSFDVGFFDLIIADESHRSVYNVYGDLFGYFDSLHVGLTATPVSFVTRNTFDLFQCDGGLPTYYYSLEEAIESNPRYLTPFEVFDHTTQFLREGIHLEGLTAEQIAELEEQGEDPENYDFSSEQIDKAIYNRDTNRQILRNLMENGLRTTGDQTIGKTIIFARSHAHAELLFEIFNEMYPQYGGKFCAVIDTYNPRAESLIDDFKDVNNPLTIAISVDMLDTGIDVPEILNLVFAKPIKSPVKFWQMVGRGTRLCLDLFGPGKDKSVFRIFDHWANFARFEEGYKPAEPIPTKSLLHLLFEQRVLLADTALKVSDIESFNRTIELVSRDIEALPENSVAVRDKWREKRSTGSIEKLKEFAPTTKQVLLDDLAPLMQWRTFTAKREAYQFDLLVSRIQVAVLVKSADIDDLKIDFMTALTGLSMHLNQVREKADTIKRAKSDGFWNALSVATLEEVRIKLREIIHFREKQTTAGVRPKIVDITEDTARIELNRRSSTLTSVDMAAYRELIEAELKKHFETDPVLQKVRAGEPVSESDLNAIVSLVLTQNPDVKRDDLLEFFAETALPLDITLRSMVGLDPKTVSAKFSNFVLEHPTLTAKQTRFIALLQNHIIKFGFITPDKLYEQPFTVVDADGPEGIFAQPKDMDELMNIVSHFSPPEKKRDSDTKEESKN